MKTDLPLRLNGAGLSMRFLRSEYLISALVAVRRVDSVEPPQQSRRPATTKVDCCDNSQHAVLLSGYGDSIERMRMQDTLGVVPRSIDGAVNRDTGWIDRPPTGVHSSTLRVDFNEAGGADPLTHHSNRG